MAGADMAYRQRTDRAHPSLVLLVLDQSQSMGATVAGERRTKAVALADAVNRVIYELVLRCVKNSAEGPRHYYDLGLITYGPQNTFTKAAAGPGWGGSLAGRVLVSSVEAANAPLSIETRQLPNGQSAQAPVWYVPESDGLTPMSAALNLAGSTTGQWIRAHQDSFPPVIIHVTDGESTDGDPSVWAERIRGLSTSDGHALLFNLSLSHLPGEPVMFPSSDAALPNEHAKQLFEMSSELPPFMCDAARASGIPVSEGSRGFVHNADIAAVVSFFQIGTSTVHLTMQ
jgi:hypothetical protein